VEETADLMESSEYKRESIFDKNQRMWHAKPI
jgi:hypothetical protein